MTKKHIRPRIVWITLYTAFLSAVAFAGTPTVPETNRAGLSPVAIDAQAPAFSLRALVERVDI